MTGNERTLIRDYPCAICLPIAHKSVFRDHNIRFQSAGPPKSGPENKSEASHHPPNQLRHSHEAGMKQISNEVAADSDRLEEEAANPGGIKQRVLTLVATQDSLGEALCH